MAYVAMRPESAIVVDVLIPNDVPAEQRAAFEEAATEFLLGPELIRPEIMAELVKKGVNAHALMAAYDEPSLAVCPTVGDRPFIPGPALIKLMSEHKISLTSGGSLHIDFHYSQASKMNYPSNVLYVRLRVPNDVAKNMTDEVTGEIVTALFGDCDLPARVKDFLSAHGIDLQEVAHSVGAQFQEGRVPPTTRVGELAARRLAHAGLDVNQFGSLKVLEVTAHR